MKTMKRFMQRIEKIARQNGFNLYETDPDKIGAVLTVRSAGLMPLKIATVGVNQVAVYHSRVDDYGDTVYDPEVVFFTGYRELGWVPMTITQPTAWIMGRPIGGFKRVAMLAQDYSAITRYYPRAMKDVAHFCNTLWYGNLSAYLD